MDISHAKNNDWISGLEDIIINNKGAKDDSNIFYVGESTRRSGKTTAILLMSMMYSIPIVSSNHGAAELMYDISRNLITDDYLPKSIRLKLAVDGKSAIPEIKTVNQFVNSRGRRYPEGVLLDLHNVEDNKGKVLPHARSNGIMIRGGFCQV